MPKRHESGQKKDNTAKACRVRRVRRVHRVRCVRRVRRMRRVHRVRRVRRVPRVRGPARIYLKGFVRGGMAGTDAINQPDRSFPG